MRLCVTGAAGFIGFHLTRRLLADGHEVVAVDSLNHYYDVTLKLARLEALGVDVSTLEPGKTLISPRQPRFSFTQVALEDADLARRVMTREPLDGICHLAAQAGVRYSTVNPRAYVDSNLSGFLTVLEVARELDGPHLVYGSSSSVYGERDDPPFRTTDRVEEPRSLYAATKRANELMATAYTSLYGVRATGLRFFTVYGPFGRPDMAYFKFVRRIFAGEPIEVYNGGDLSRDFTYVDDVVEAIVRVLALEAPSGPKHTIYNVGRGRPVRLLDFIHALEAACGRTAKLEFLPMQPGDVSTTWADCSTLERDIGFRPQVDLAEGAARFVQWYLSYYGDQPRPSDG